MIHLAIAWLDAFIKDKENKIQKTASGLYHDPKRNLI